MSYSTRRGVGLKAAKNKKNDGGLTAATIKFQIFLGIVYDFEKFRSFPPFSGNFRGFFLGRQILRPRPWNMHGIFWNKKPIFCFFLEFYIDRVPRFGSPQIQFFFLEFHNGHNHPCCCCLALKKRGTRKITADVMTHFWGKILVIFF